MSNSLSKFMVGVFKFIIFRHENYKLRCSEMSKVAIEIIGKWAHLICESCIEFISRLNLSSNMNKISMKSK